MLRYIYTACPVYEDVYYITNSLRTNVLKNSDNLASVVNCN